MPSVRARYSSCAFSCTNAWFSVLNTECTTPAAIRMPTATQKSVACANATTRAMYAADDQSIERMPPRPAATYHSPIREPTPTADSRMPCSVAPPCRLRSTKTGMNDTYG